MFEVSNYQWNGSSGQITAYDDPSAMRDFPFGQFETTVVANNWLGTGKDAALATFRWGFTNNGTNSTHTGITLQKVTATHLKIIANDYPTYQLIR